MANIDKKKSIGEVAKELEVQTHVIRFWESKFPQIKPVLGKGGRRYYFAKDVEVLKKIKNFLYNEGYTISGLQNLLRKRKKADHEKDLQIITGDENSVITEPAAEKSLTFAVNQQNAAEQLNLISNIEIQLDNFEKLLLKN